MNNIEKKFYTYYIESIIFDEKKLDEFLKSSENLDNELLTYIFKYIIVSNLIDNEIRNRLLDVINKYRFKDNNNINLCNDMIRMVNINIDTDPYYFNQVITRDIDPMGVNGLAEDYCKKNKKTIYKSISNDFNAIQIITANPDELMGSEEFIIIIEDISKLISLFRSIRAIRIKNPEIFENEYVMDNICTLYVTTKIILKKVRKYITRNDVICIELKQGIKTLKRLIIENAKYFDEAESKKRY